MLFGSKPKLDEAGAERECGNSLTLVEEQLGFRSPHSDSIQDGSFELFPNLTDSILGI